MVTVQMSTCGLEMLLRRESLIAKENMMKGSEKSR